MMSIQITPLRRLLGTFGKRWLRSLSRWANDTPQTGEGSSCLGLATTNMIIANPQVDISLSRSSLGYPDPNRPRSNSIAFYADGTGHTMLHRLALASP